MKWSEAKELSKNGEICDNCIHNIEFECCKHGYSLRTLSRKNQSDIAYETACKDWKKAPPYHRGNWYC